MLSQRRKGAESEKKLFNYKILPSKLRNIFSHNVLRSHPRNSAPGMRAVR
jgi:hypothetical protein